MTDAECLDAMARQLSVRYVGTNPTLIPLGGLIKHSSPFLGQYVVEFDGNIICTCDPKDLQVRFIGRPSPVTVAAPGHVLSDAECAVLAGHGAVVSYVGGVAGPVSPGDQGTLRQRTSHRSAVCWSVVMDTSGLLVCRADSLVLLSYPTHLYGRLVVAQAAAGWPPAGTTTFTPTAMPSSLNDTMSPKDFAERYAGQWCTTKQTSTMPAGVRAKIIGYVDGTVVIATAAPVFVPGGLTLRSDTRIPVGMFRVCDTLLTHFMQQTVDFLVPDGTVEAPVDLKDFPHACPRCSSPAYCGALTVECTNASCQHHKVTT